MIQTAHSDQELAACARRGDREAFGILVERHWESLVRLVYRMVGDPALAEDAAQEACLRAWLRLDTYKPEFAFRNWFFSIGVNAAIDARRRKDVPVAVEFLDHVDSSPGPEARAERHEKAARVQHAVLALPPASRAVLVLREYEGLSYQQIAQTLSIPIGTVMSRLNYARNHLREELRAYLEAE